MRRLLALTGLVLGVLALSLVWYRSLSKGSHVRDPREADSNAPALANGVDAFAPPRQPSQRLPSIEELTSLPRGRVLSILRQPIANASVRWLALRQQDLEPNPAWPAAGWGEVQRDAVETRTASDGAFEFSTSPAAAAFGSVLVVLDDHHWPNGLDLAVDSREWPPAIEIVLEEASPVVVEVLDALDRPQAGAVVQHSAVPREVRLDEAAVPRFERFLAQSATTDASGRVELAPFRGEQAFWAEKEELLSMPWQGPPAAHVVLRLGPSFTVGGTVAFSARATWDPSYTGERRIQVLGRTGSLWRPIRRLRGVEEGAWGPLRVPLDGSTRFRVRLEGAPIAPQEVLLDPPPANAYRRVDFTADKEAELWFFVTDEAERPIPSARALVWWGATDDAPQHVEGAAQPDGFLYTGTFPPGFVKYRIRAPGYAQLDGYIQVPIDYTMPIALARGGSILGRCLHDGAGLADFEVIYGKQGPTSQLLHESFLGRENGSFELAGLAPGDWSVQASSLAFPAGPPIVVAVTGTEPAHVELELPSAALGGGRVLDAASGAPLSNASVQAYSSGGVQRSFPWGAPVATAPDGSFELEAFVRGKNFLRVSCEGFAEAEFQANLGDEPALAWGDLRLFRPQALELQLLGCESLQRCRLEELVAHTMESPHLPERRFGADGSLRYEGVAPGDYRLLLDEPNGSFTRLHLHLEPGRVWRFEHRIAGAKRLTVRVLDEQGQPARKGLLVLLGAIESAGAYVLREVATEGEAFLFEGIQATQGQIWVYDRTGIPLASRDVELGPGESTEIEVRLGAKPLRVHVVDPEGGAIASAVVTLRSASGDEIYGVDDTDARGWAEVLGVPKGPLTLDVTHGIHGRRLGVPVDGSKAEIEVVLEAAGSLELRIVDGSELLAGVSVRLETISGVATSDQKQTSDEGTVRFAPLGEGHYRAACRRADGWPSFIEEELEPEEHAALDVQMRRLADLELTLRNADGVPAAGVALELRSVEFDVSVEEWLSERRVQGTPGLKTDVSGQLHLQGLPHGSYAWSSDGNGTPTNGVFELAPRNNEITLWLPPSR